jgi:hypothetical protein
MPNDTVRRARKLAGEWGAFHFHDTLHEMADQIERLEKIEAAARRVVAAYWLAPFREHFGKEDETLPYVDDLAQVVDPDGEIPRLIQEGMDMTYDDI